MSNTPSYTESCQRPSLGEGINNPPLFMNEIPVSKRLIISIYDFTGNWVKPYINAGYPVMLWDKKVEGDILEGFSWLLTQIEETGLQVYGILGACPCNDFASSGARWFEGKDKPTPGYEPFDNTTELSIALVQIVLHLVDLLKPKFWVIENPVGRIERLNEELKPYRNYSFDPHDFGEPYPKKTILWGEFNNNLVKTPVLPLYKEYIHNQPPGEKRAEIRSATPAGFAKAFFQANR